MRSTDRLGCRRSWITSLTFVLLGGVLLIAPPARAADKSAERRNGATCDNPESHAADFEDSVTRIIENEKDLRNKIVELRKLQLAHPAEFSWKLHNELRHLYNDLDDAEAARQSDILLHHSPMDGYILSILSDWNLDKDPHTAIAALLRHARSAPGCTYLKAACWVKVAELYRGLADEAASNFYYHKVLSLEGLEESAYTQRAEKALGLSK